jgi:hypothetical protein
MKSLKEKWILASTASAKHAAFQACEAAKKVNIERMEQTATNHFLRKQVRTKNGSVD